MVINCILCGKADPGLFYREDSSVPFLERDYYRCGRCKLIFVPPDQHLSPEEEFKRYELHENNPYDPGYRKFLGRLFNPMSERIKPESYGLDFGSGPGPALSVMFEEKGHKMRLFDIFYKNDPSVFKEKYDFITTTETVEHLSRPREELDRLWSCLRPGGWMGIMTKRAGNLKAFKNWHYKNDGTHVIFFSEETFHWLGRHWGTKPEFQGSDVVLFKKDVPGSIK